MEDEAGAEQLGHQPARALDGTEQAEDDLGVRQVTHQDGEDDGGVYEGQPGHVDAGVRDDDREVPAGM